MKKMRALEKQRLELLKKFLREKKELIFAPQALYYFLPLTIPWLRMATAVAARTPISPSSIDLYEQLPYSETDRANILDIITTMATSNIASLISQYSRLCSLGKTINAHVHPLKFIAVIMTAPELKMQPTGHLMKSIWNEWWPFFRKSNFVDGFATRMAFESEHDNLRKFIPGFSRTIGVEETTIHHYCDEKNWVGLLDDLVSRL